MTCSATTSIDILQLAIEYGIKFMETSAKAALNVEEVGFV